MAELEIKPTPQMRLRVAALIFVGCVISATEMYLLAGGLADVFARRSTLTTFMADAAGVTTESEVRLSGIRIGQVQSVELSGSQDPPHTVRIQMRVLTRYLKFIPADSQTDVNADTIVADKFIDVAEGKSAIPIAENAVLPAKPMPQATDRADVLAALQDRLTQIDHILTQMESPDTDLGKFVQNNDVYDSMLAFIGDFDTGIHAFLNPQSELGQAVFTPELYNRMRNIISKTDNILSSIQNGEGTAGHMFATDEQYNEWVRELVELHSAVADANAGKGRLGALLQDDGDYQQIARLLGSMDATLDSLNAGEGQGGRLLTNAQAYESLNSSLRRMEAELRDLREHPQKYLRVRHKIF